MNGWSAEARQRQSELIRHWRPWERSTGPRTPQGKERVARNAYKGDTRSMLRKLARLLRDGTKSRVVEIRSCARKRAAPGKANDDTITMVRDEL